MSLIGPGAMTEYGSEPSRRRSRGTVYVNDPAVGFFVAGSSLSLNGIYVRKDPRRLLGVDSAALAYVHESSGWVLALIITSEDSDEEDDDEREYEWRFLEAGSRRAILGHDGDTLIPGSGRRWRQLKAKALSDFDSDALTKAKSSDELEDELPWQVIALLDAGIVRDLLASKRYRDSKVAASLRGDDLPKLHVRSPHAVALEQAPHWLYTVIVEKVELTHLTKRRFPLYAYRGECLKIIEHRGDDLLLLGGDYIVPSSACAFIDAAGRPTLDAPALEDDDDDLYDKPFEPRIQDDDADEGPEVDDDDDDDDQETEDGSYALSESRDRYEIAQPATQIRKQVGDGCHVIRHGRVVQGTVTSLEEDRIGVVFEGTRAQFIEARSVIKTDDVNGVWLGGVDIKDSENFTKNGLKAAYRAAERDAVFEARLYSSAANKYKEDAAKKRRDALETLLPTVFSTVTTTTTTTTKARIMSPLEAVAHGATGARAAQAASKATSAAKLVDARRAVAALRQIVCDESARLSNDESDEDDLCRLRLAASLANTAVGSEGDDCGFARSALDANPASGAPKVVVGLELLRKGRRDEAATLLKKAIDLGPAAGSDGVWAAKRAAECLRSISRATKLKVKADDAYRRGDLPRARDFYSDAIETLERDDAGLHATLISNRAACRRRLRELDAALLDVDSALRLFPTYQKALFRRAVILMELDKPKAAKSAFLDLLRINRNWPKLAEWLTRCVANLKRKHPNAPWDFDEDFQDDADDVDPLSSSSSSGEVPAAPDGVEMSNPDVVIDHYTVLGVDADASHTQLKRAYRLRSLKFHPDKASGSTVAFQRVAEAFDVLSDPEKRSQYDLGGDLNKKKKKMDDTDSSSDDDNPEKKRSLHEQVERKWFPERYEFYPFGDPFVEKRKLRARRANQNRSSSNCWWDPETF